MDQAEALLAIAQIALGLAGFGGVFVAVGRQHGATRGAADSYRLVLLLGTALATLVLSLVPVALGALGLGDAAVWQVASGLLALLLAALLAVARRDRRRHAEEIRRGESPAVAAAILALSVATLAAQVLGAFGVFGGRGFGVFLSGLVFLVAFGSYLFARMLFLWRS